MLERPGNFIARRRMRLATAATASLIWAIVAGAAWPQAVAPPPTPGVQAPVQPPPQSEPSPAAPPAREASPGLLNEIGKMFGQLPTLKGTQESIESLNARAKDAAKDASDSLSRLAKPASMVAGRMICPPSSNGAPDCKTGADKLCQAKGYKEGKSLMTDSAETCSAKVLIPGRARKPDDCRTDNYVTSALCQ